MEFTAIEMLLHRSTEYIANKCDLQKNKEREGGEGRVLGSDMF